jgi:hypothetical protein
MINIIQDIIQIATLVILVVLFWGGILNINDNIEKIKKDLGECKDAWLRSWVEKAKKDD